MTPASTAPTAARRFREWYSRRLALAFALLTTCLLCGVLVAVILEFVGLRTAGLTPLITVIVLYVVGLIAVESFRRFWSTLSRAQACANEATCANCGAYGLFDVRDDDPPMDARCHRCGHRWRIG